MCCLAESAGGAGGGGHRTRKSRTSLDIGGSAGGGHDETDGSYYRRLNIIDRHDGGGRGQSWGAPMGTIEPSDTESVESGKSSPSAASPLIPGKLHLKVALTKTLMYSQILNESTAQIRVPRSNG